MQVEMNAMELREYGSADVFRMVRAIRPIPKPNEILIRNYATTVTGADIMMRTGKPYIGRLYLGLRRPKRAILGFEFAGEVVETGEAVRLFKAGDKVFGGTTGLGSYAEYLCVNENDVITTMPENISYEEAAPVNGSAVTVMNFLKGLGKIEKGQKVLINGASGALGTYSIQIAKYFGATVTGVCSSGNEELVRSLGADRVIDYTRQDFSKEAEQYDIIFDTVGKLHFSQCKPSLTEKGVFLSSVVGFRLLLQMMMSSLSGAKRAKFSATGMLPVRERLAYFLELKELLRTGALKTVIDPNQYKLEQMKEAHRYVEKGHKKGNLIVKV